MRKGVVALCVTVLAAACTPNPVPVQPSPAVIVQPAGRPAAFGWDGINQRVAMLYQQSAGSDLAVLDLTGTSWVQVSSLRSNAAFATFVYDSDRKREVVLTEPYNMPSQTFEWDGKTWLESAPKPGGLTQYTDAAYSPDLHAMVLLDSGTWLYDGKTWRQATTRNSPPTRIARYDAAHRVVLALDESSFKTWRFDGTDWTVLPLEGFTPEYRGGVGRQWPAVALDSSGHWVLFSGDITLSDTWTWDGQYWTRASTASPPQGRVNGVMTWDFGRKRMLMFGGFGDVGHFGSSGDLKDTWSWDGQSWTLAAGTVYAPTPSTNPASGTRTSPAPAEKDVVGEAHYNGVAPDGRGGLIMIASPSFSASFTDTWRWDGTAWHLMPTDLSPDANFGGSLTFDPAHNVVVAYGDPGAFGEGRTGQEQTWTWNGKSWTMLHPVRRPPPMYQPSVAYDDAMSEIVLFGVVYDASAASSLVLGEAQTWAWDGSDWTQLHPAASPPAHYGATMTFDAAVGRLVLIGGRTSTTEVMPSPVTWAFDGATWTELDNTGPQVDEMSTGYDPVTRRMVVLARPGVTYLRDSTGWSHPRLNPFPSGGTVGLALEPRAQRLTAVMAGPGNLLLWRWWGSGWSLIWPSSYAEWRTYQSPAGFGLKYPPYWYLFDQYALWSNYDVGTPLAAGLDAVFLQVSSTPGACSAPSGVVAQSATTVGGVAGTRYRWDTNVSEPLSHLAVRANRSGSCFDLELMGFSSSAVDGNAALFDQIVATVTFA